MANRSVSNASNVALLTGTDNTCYTSMLAFMLSVRAAVFVFGVPGNCLILRVYWNKARRKTSTHVLIMALAWADLFVCLFLSVGVVEHALKCGGNDVDLIFWLITTFTRISVAASLGITAVIAVDRYDCVCRPQRRYFTPRRAKVAVFVVVLLSVMVNIPVSIIYYLYAPVLEIYLLVPIWKIIAFSFAFLTTVLCYGKVYARILKHVGVGAKPDLETQNDQLDAKIDMNRTILSASQSTLSRNGQFISAIHRHANKKGKGSDRNSKSSNQLPTSSSDTPARIEANTSVVDDEVSTVIILTNSKCTTHGSTSRREITEVPQKAKCGIIKLVNPAGCENKVGLKSVSQAISQKCFSRSADPARREHASKRQGGAVLQRKTTKMLFVTSVVFLLTWLPDVISNAIEIAHFPGIRVDTESTFGNVLEWISFTIFVNNAINPFIYGLANRRFRKDCREVFRKIRR